MTGTKTRASRPDARGSGHAATDPRIRLAAGRFDFTTEQEYPINKTGIIGNDEEVYEPSPGRKWNAARPTFVGLCRRRLQGKARGVAVGRVDTVVRRRRRGDEA